MDPTIINIAIYLAIAAGGYAVRWLQNRQSSATPIVLPGTPAPAAPDPQLTIGNGLLLQLLVNAMKAGMASVPGLPGSSATPVLPETPPAPSPAPIDMNALLQMMQKLLDAQPRPASPPG